MTAKKKTDLSSLSPTIACDKGFEFELKDPFTSEPLGAFISVTGREGTAFRNHVRKKANEGLKKQASGKEQVQTVEELEAAGVELCVACTTGWRDITWQGADLPFSPENARTVYAEKWIRDQVEEAILDLGNFTPA